MIRKIFLHAGEIPYSNNLKIFTPNLSEKNTQAGESDRTISNNVLEVTILSSILLMKKCRNALGKF